MAARRTPNQEEQPQERISVSSGSPMIVVAAGLDGLQGVVGIVPIIGFIASPIMSFFIWLTFWIWLKLHGITIGDSIERIAVMFGGFVIELIPVLNVLPAWTLTIFITVLIVQRADRKKLKEFLEQQTSLPQEA